MSDNPTNNHAPFDDYGVNNDHILDICEALIKQLWKRAIADQQEMTIADIKDAALTVDALWNLIQSIIEVNEELQNGGENNQGNPGTDGPNLPGDEPPNM